MKFVLDTNHLEFFENNHYIEFESLLTEQELQEVQLHLPEALAHAMQGQKIKDSLTAENQFALGHDLWRFHPFFQKLAKKKHGRNWLPN